MPTWTARLSFERPFACPSSASSMASAGVKKLGRCVPKLSCAACSSLRCNCPMPIARCCRNASSFATKRSVGPAWRCSGRPSTQASVVGERICSPNVGTAWQRSGASLSFAGGMPSMPLDGSKFSLWTS